MATADELQKVFKTLSDPTRVRILRLLEAQELVVQELMEVLGMAQSRVSRHLAILREAGLLLDRRDGTYVSYRFVPPENGTWREAWTLVENNLEGDPTAERDRAVLQRVIGARGNKSRSFFDAVGPEWDALRKVFDDDILRARAINRLIPSGLRVADIGTGTGILALELSRLGLEVIGVDNSERMLEAARSKLEAVGIEVDLRQGEADSIPVEDQGVDAAFSHMVLQYIPEPLRVLEEMARITRPGGRVVTVDFVSHEHDWMRQELGVVWLGFDPDVIAGWYAEAGLEDVDVEVFEPTSGGRDLPATLIASARRAAS